MPFKNPINNLLTPISKVISCKLCGCQNLAWAQFANGKWHLCSVQFERETAAGNVRRGPWANKSAIHNCEKYIQQLQEAANRLSDEERKAVCSTLSNAISYLLWDKANGAWSTDKGALDAAVIISQAATRI